jgi:dipeptidyl aminopeptidase/acylaminoacyl peptidase
MTRVGILIVAFVLAASAAAGTVRPNAAETSRARVHCLAAAPPDAALPTWWPKGESIAFTVPREESGAIVRAAPAAFGFWTVFISADSAPVKLVWSPDGEIIAFEKRTGAIAITGTGRFSWNEEIVHAEYGTTTELGDWSPDSTHLVFSRHGQIYSVDVHTKEIRKIADGGVHPTWSPDGEEIAFAAPPRSLARPPRVLEVVRPDGNDRRVLVADAASVESIAWSPDSSELAFAGPVIGIVSRTGGPAEYTEPAEPPIVWRPSGIFYSVTSVPPERIAPVRFDPDTDTTVRLTYLPPGFNGRFGAASPNGELIAYDLEVNSVHAGLRIVNAFGQNDRPLLACRGTNRNDRVVGSPLNDVIRVLGAGIDHVRCGAGRDVVYADRRDRVALDCERIVRS